MIHLKEEDGVHTIIEQSDIERAFFETENLVPGYVYKGKYNLTVGKELSVNTLQTINLILTAIMQQKELMKLFCKL